MLVFRSLALGLLGTCVLLLATRPPYEVRVMRESTRVVRVEPPTSATIVDVAPSVLATQLPSVLQLGDDEHVASVDDVSVRDDLEAGARLATIATGAHRFVDLTVVGSASGSRRVLVLFH